MTTPVFAHHNLERFSSTDRPRSRERAWSVSSGPRGNHSASQERARITVARTIEEVEALGPQFERLPPEDVDGDLDFFLTVVRHHKAVLRPHVVLIELSDGREVRVVARLEQHRGSRQFGIRPLRLLQVSFDGVVGTSSAADCALVLQALRNALGRGEADLVVLPRLEVGTPLYTAARTGDPWWRADHRPRKSVQWSAHVPDSLENFLAARSANTRYNVRRYNKRLLAKHGGSLAVREFGNPEDLSSFCADAESIAATTYQRGLRVGYTGDPLQLALMELAASRGWLRAWVLYIETVPVAFWFGYCYRGTFRLVATSFNPDYGDLRVGQYLQMQMMDGLCRDPDLREFDYGAGDAEYKRRFGDRCVDQVELLVFGPSIHSAAANASHTLHVAATHLARTWMAHGDLGMRAKKARRNRAAKRARARRCESA